MAKKKKRAKTKYTFICEGDREYYMLKYLNVLILDKINKIIHKKGGTAESIMLEAIKLSHTYPNLVVIFDQDFQHKQPITEDTLKALQESWNIEESLIGIDYKDLASKNTNKKNPIVIVSHPSSIEGFILRVFGRDQRTLEGKTTTQLKGELVTLMDNILRDVDINAEQENIEGLTQDLKKYCLFLMHSNFVQKMKDTRHKVLESDMLLKLFETD